MNDIDVTVICLTYNSDKGKLFETLESVVEQKDCVFEIIVSDDGSEKNYFDDIKVFFSKRNFVRYKLHSHERNVGIIKNYLSGVELATGTYIKPISPGDYLYDDTTLAEWHSFMVENSAKVSFGKSLHYNFRDNKLYISNNSIPVITDLYDTQSNNYNFEKVLKHLTLYQDHILGAALFVDRICIKQYLNEVKDKVVFTEDSATLPLFTIDQHRIYCFERFVLWYENDSGISTNVNRGFKKRLNLDHLAFLKILTEKRPDDWYLKVAYWHQYFVVKKIKLMVSMIKRFEEIFMGRMYFNYKKKRLKGKSVSGYTIYNFHRLKEKVALFLADL